MYVYHYCFVTGYYMYIETSAPAVTGNKARLQSPVYSAQTAKECIHFWYYMFGTNIGTLSVYLLPTTQGSRSTLFSRSGNQADLWLYQTLNLFQGVGNGYQVSSFNILKCLQYILDMLPVNM